MEDTSLQAHTAGQTDLLFYTIAHLAIPHAMFTRQGGVSQSPFSGLNLSLGVGDEPTAVQVNREKVKKELNIQLLASAVQVHGDQIVLVEDLSSDHEYQGADALISAQAGVGLMIQQADCQAVLLHDPQRKAIAAIHNGWRGSVANIIAKTVQAMEEHFGTSPQDLQAVISPSLGPCCAEFIQYRQELPETFQQWQEPETYFDFWEISRWQLREAGLDNEQIKAAELCTMCNKDFFPIAGPRRS